MAYGEVGLEDLELFKKRQKGNSVRVSRLNTL